LLSLKRQRFRVVPLNQASIPSSINNSLADKIPDLTFSDVLTSGPHHLISSDNFSGTRSEIACDIKCPVLP